MMPMTPLGATVKGAYTFVPETSGVVGRNLPDAASMRARAMMATRYPTLHILLEHHYYGFSGVQQMGRGYATIPIVQKHYGTSWMSSLAYQPRASYTPLGVVGTPGG